MKNLREKSSILAKLGIESLNRMQEESREALSQGRDLLLLSPTGSGKTLAFLLPLIEKLPPQPQALAILILCPSRELALQIEQVARQMGSGLKVNAVYGGRPIARDKEELQHTPQILIGTPGRVADHLRRGSFDISQLSTLVLDEFDKSLETGFESQMKEIISSITSLKHFVLTSATDSAIPDFVKLRNPLRLEYLDTDDSKLSLRVVDSADMEKIAALQKLLRHLGGQRGIIFCNFRESVEELSSELSEAGFDHSCFYGGLEQKERERALIQFRNGSHRLLLATDLAARGLDIPELDFIIHYQLPFKEEEFTHRNGRTARMKSEGAAYLFRAPAKELPAFIGKRQPTLIKATELKAAPPTKNTRWQTLMISGGRRDKISKGDIAGLLIKQGKLQAEQVGYIELKHDCAFVSVPAHLLREVSKRVDQSKLKKKKVRIRAL